MTYRDLFVPDNVSNMILIADSNEFGYCLQQVSQKNPVHGLQKNSPSPPTGRGSGRPRPKPSPEFWLWPGLRFWKAKAVPGRAKAGASRPSRAGTSLFDIYHTWQVSNQRCMVFHSVLLASSQHTLWRVSEKNNTVARSLQYVKLK